MLRVSLRSFWDHKRRLISTIIAIVLGVAFMCGTFVLTDTLDQVFDDLFAEGNAKVDAQVQGTQWMMQWVRQGRMLRLTWRIEGGGKTASVSLVDGRVLDAWGRARGKSQPS